MQLKTMTFQVYFIVYHIFPLPSLKHYSYMSIFKPVTVAKPFQSTYQSILTARDSYYYIDTVFQQVHYL